MVLSACSLGLDSSTVEDTGEKDRLQEKGEEKPGDVGSLNYLSAAGTHHHLCKGVGVRYVDWHLLGWEELVVLVLLGLSCRSALD